MRKLILGIAISLGLTFGLSAQDSHGDHGRDRASVANARSIGSRRCFFVMSEETTNQQSCGGKKRAMLAGGGLEAPSTKKPRLTCDPRAQTGGGMRVSASKGGTSQSLGRTDSGKPGNGHTCTIASPQGVPWPLCRREGCTGPAQKRGLCLMHWGLAARCTIEGCTNAAKARGVCRKHGPNLKTCIKAGCPNQAINHGVCLRHGAKVRICGHPGCRTYAQRGGRCAKHGAKRQSCSRPGCLNQAVQGGVCVRHGAKRPPCAAAGCQSYAQRGSGVCIKHGVRPARGAVCPLVCPLENEAATCLLDLRTQPLSGSGP